MRQQQRPRYLALRQRCLAIGSVLAVLTLLPTPREERDFNSNQTTDKEKQEE